MREIFIIRTTIPLFEVLYHEFFMEIGIKASSFTFFPSGKQVITCAPRFVKEESDGAHRWGHGKCFTLSSSSGSSSGSPSGSSGSLRHSETWDPCEGRSKSRAHEEWGYCQVRKKKYFVIFLSKYSSREKKTLITVQLENFVIDGK